MPWNMNQSSQAEDLPSDYRYSAVLVGVTSATRLRQLRDFLADLENSSIVEIAAAPLHELCSLRDFRLDLGTVDDNEGDEEDEEDDYGLGSSAVEEPVPVSASPPTRMTWAHMAATPIPTPQRVVSSTGPAAPFEEPYMQMNRDQLAAYHSRVRDELITLRRQHENGEINDSEYALDNVRLTRLRDAVSARFSAVSNDPSLVPSSPGRARRATSYAIPRFD